MELDQFIQGYIACMLWTEEEPLLEDADLPAAADDLAPETVALIRQECQEFVEANRRLITEAVRREPSYTWARAGHDFWLTRNHHGAGYWDRGLEEVGELLTNAAQARGEKDLYRGDDTLLYLA